MIARQSAGLGGAPYRCLHGMNAGHRLRDGTYSCDPSNPLFTDPQIEPRHVEVERLEKLIVQLKSSTAPKNAVAVATKAIRARITALKKEIATATKAAEKSRADFDPKIEALRTKAAEARKVLDAALAEVSQVENERAEFRQASRLPRLEALGFAKTDWRDLVLKSGLALGADHDDRYRYEMLVSSAARLIESPEQLALTLAALASNPHRKWTAQGERSHKRSTPETELAAIEAVCAEVLARLTREGAP